MVTAPSGPGARDMRGAADATPARRPMLVTRGAERRCGVLAPRALTVLATAPLLWPDLDRAVW